jgi:hypothetical protein
MIAADRPRSSRLAGIIDSVVGGKTPIAQPA